MASRIFNWTQKRRRGHKPVMVMAGFWIWLWAALAPAQAGEIARVDVGETEITIQFDDVVAGARGFTLTDPNRIAIDIEGATASRAEKAGNGLVRSVRWAQHDGDTARVVLDLDGPALIRSGRFSADGRTLSLSLRELAASEAGAMARADTARFLPPAAFRAAPGRGGKSVRFQLAAVKPAVDLPAVQGPKDPTRPLIVIDAGHGGHDPGAINPENGTREKDVTLRVAQAIRDELLATGRFRVALTRDEDAYLVHRERFGIARRLNADLFISVHADSAESQEARGATVYTLSEIASDREAAQLAARENKSDIINGVDLAQTSSDVQSILIDLTQRETMNLSSDFARLLSREGSNRMRFKPEPHRFASLLVLKAPDIPSVLFETGYISNSEDTAFLSSDSGRKRIAGSVADAVTVFFAKQLASR